MGKTTLARAFGAECQTLGFGWLECDCNEADLDLGPMLARLTGLDQPIPSDPQDFLRHVDLAFDRLGLGAPTQI